MWTESTELYFYLHFKDREEVSWRKINQGPYRELYLCKEKNFDSRALLLVADMQKSNESGNEIDMTRSYQGHSTDSVNIFLEGL